MAVDVVSLGIVCADVLVHPFKELPGRGELELVPTLELHLGGLAAVTGTVLQQLGMSTAFIGKVGVDGFGDFLLSTLRQEGVNIDGVRRVHDLRTPAAVVFISKDGERSFLHHVGANATLTGEDVRPEQLEGARLLHWGGPGVLPGLDGPPIADVMDRARAAGLRTSMDTCYDGSGRWFANIEHALPRCDIVMSGLEEGRHYTGRESPEDMAEFYRSYGPHTVMIKCGDQGMYLRDNATEVWVPPYEVRVKDTTGAGDAACAGFLYGYLNDWDLEACGRLASAVGALTVQQLGGSGAIRSLEATLEFMEHTNR